MLSKKSVTLHFVIQGIKASNNFTLQFTQYKNPCSWEDYYFTLISEFFFNQWNYENLIYQVKNLILQSNLTLFKALFHDEKVSRGNSRVEILISSLVWKLSS